MYKLSKANRAKIIYFSRVLREREEKTNKQIFRISVIGNLWFVGLGSILLNLLAWSAHRQKIGPNAIQPLIGAILLGYHCIINDAIIWNVMYPW